MDKTMCKSNFLVFDTLDILCKIWYNKIINQMYIEKKMTQLWVVSQN